MKINSNKIGGLICISLLVLASTSCSLTKGKETSERAVNKFHSQLNASQFHEIYAQTDEAFRKAMSEPDAIAYFEAVHRKLGDVKDSRMAGWRVNATPLGTMVNMGYQVEFAEGKGTEDFMFHVTGDQALLVNYTVNSPLLITK
jgi:hypothetical protein